MRENDKRALSLLGFAARAGRLTVGVPLLCEAMRKGTRGKTPLLVALACDASPNTKKRILDRTAYYGVRLVRLEVDTAALALAVGKREGAVAAVGVTDPHLASAIGALFDET
ncbi:MAG: hypothetical protein E7663_02435 [Ruminococcaceae bacterium]|nr:hypothetical protein [Oscillospiraceae bacterium]